MIDHRRAGSTPTSSKSREQMMVEDEQSLLSKPKPLHDELVVDSVLFWIKSPLRTRFFVICAAIFANMFLYGLFIGLAPYYRKDLELSQFELGSLFSVFSVVPLILVPTLGLFIDQTPQKLFFGVGGFVCAISSLVMAVWDGTFTGVLIARVLHGFGASVIWVTGPAVVSEVFALPSHTRAMSVVYIYATAAYLVGTVMGANSFDWTGSTVPIYISTFLMNLCTTVFVLSNLEPDTHSIHELPALVSKQNFWEGWAEYRALLQHRSVIVLMTQVFVFSLATVVLQTFIPSWVQYNLGTSVSGAADIYAVMGTAKICSQPFFGRLTHVMLPHHISAVGMMVYGVLLPLLPVAWNWILDVIAFALVGLAMTAVLLPSFLALSNLVDNLPETGTDKNRRFVLANSMWLVMFMLGSTIAPIAVGALLDNFPAGGLAAHAAVLGGLGAVMTLVQGPLYLMFSNADHEATLASSEKQQYC